MSNRIHITTAIFYCNAPPHVGSAYEALVADTFARFQRRRYGSQNVSFLTGTDEHGDKIRRAALAQGTTPKEFTDRMSEVFRQAFRGLNINFDFFVRTTDPEHERFVQDMLSRTYARGDIYFTEYQGQYCVGCERFYSERELLTGSICPEHNSPTELISEGNYFLRLEKYRLKILEHIQRNPGFIRPERYRNEALKMLAEPLGDLCISRPKNRLDWGIELPFDSNYVTYVWYDAFWAYLSRPSREFPEFLTDVLPHTFHFIGKDILKTHAVYWPAILMAAGLPLFQCLNVHGYLNFGGARMSKSSGNVADPVSYESELGQDVLRYFVLREVVFGLDGDFSDERLIARYNADLANDLGNLVSRVLSMAHRYFGGEMPADPNSNENSTDRDFVAEAFLDLEKRVSECVDELAFNRALERIWQSLEAMNRYIVNTSPFSLMKDAAEDETGQDRRNRAGQIISNLLEGLRVIGSVLEPFMPATSERILNLLNVSPGLTREPFGNGLRRGHKVKPPTQLFPRRDRQR